MKNINRLVLDCFKKNEILISRNEHGEPTAVEFDGAFPQSHFVTTVNYSGEARGCFGVDPRKINDGTVEGIRLPPFNYTGEQLLESKLLKATKKLRRKGSDN